ncbi:glycosyl hydrolases family 16-domain-containing protein [Lentinula raphanica]|nr:glycosyl hydrolases family 16-domain-containing protein [Lentinula raphanica]
MSRLPYNHYSFFLYLFTLLSFGFCSPRPATSPRYTAGPLQVRSSSNHNSEHTVPSLNSAHSLHGRDNPRHCQPFHTSFSDPSAVADSNADPSNSPFVALSPPETYAITENGLEMYLRRPKGEVHSANGMNDNLGEAATINSTFSMNSGKVTYEVSCDFVPGVVCAFILIDSVEASDGEMHLDEIDVELVGSGSARWQTNIFKPSNADPDPHYGHYDTKEQYPQNPSYTSLHNYSISWDSDKIVWGVDGQDTRTMRKEDTYINGAPHFPGETDSLRLQLGIWDGSGAEGTSSWAGGPVNWDNAPQKIVATVRSVSVEC